jgi:hypothetical protein
LDRRGISQGPAASFLSRVWWILGMEIWGFNSLIWRARDRFGAQGIALVGGEGRDCYGIRRRAHGIRRRKKSPVQSPAAGAKWAW